MVAAGVAQNNVTMTITFSLLRCSRRVRVLLVHVLNVSRVLNTRHLLDATDTDDCGRDITRKLEQRRYVPPFPRYHLLFRISRRKKLITGSLFLEFSRSRWPWLAITLGRSQSSFQPLFPSQRRLVNVDRNSFRPRIPPRIRTAILTISSFKSNYVIEIFA